MTMQTTTTESNNENVCDGFDLATITLSRGGHSRESDHYSGPACAIEWANRATLLCPTLREKFGAPDEFTDDHPSISPCVRRLVIALNDSLDDEDRQQLRPYVVKVLGTCDAAAETPRGWLALDALARQITPAILRAAKLDAHADAIAALAPITDVATWRASHAVFEAAAGAVGAAAGAINAADSLAPNPQFGAELRYCGGVGSLANVADSLLVGCEYDEWRVFHLLVRVLERGSSIAAFHAGHSWGTARAAGRALQPLVLDTLSRMIALRSEGQPQ